jgi:hypothetical protein
MTLPQSVIRAFPNIGKSRRTSDNTWRYNCHAFGAGEDQEWWEPIPGPVPPLPPWVKVYWPAGLPHFDLSVKNFQNAFATRGYSSCADGGLELGFEKIVFYVKNNAVSHTARQLSDGSWTSKLGANIDIVHPDPGALEGGAYGTARAYMKRSSSVQAP